MKKKCFPSFEKKWRIGGFWPPKRVPHEIWWHTDKNIPKICLGGDFLGKTKNFKWFIFWKKNYQRIKILTYLFRSLTTVEQRRFERRGTLGVSGNWARGVALAAPEALIICVNFVKSFDADSLKFLETSSRSCPQLRQILENPWLLRLFFSRGHLSLGGV